MRPSRIRIALALTAGTTAVTGIALACVAAPAALAAGPSSAMAGMDMTGGGFAPNLDPGEQVTADVPPLTTSNAQYDPAKVSHHEFRVACVPTHTAKDDPIVFPGHPGAAHDHTFLGALGVDAASTTGSLSRATTSCSTPDDHSAYWYPTVYAGDVPIVPSTPQTVYYKAGVTDYRSVHPFPKGLRFVAGDPKATLQQFTDSPGRVGFSCGDLHRVADFAAFTTPCKENDLFIRYQAPSCWDGVHIDSADHKSHMAYPVKSGRSMVCPADHPVAVPMLELKTKFPLNAVAGDVQRLRLSSGAGYSWHFDFFNAWEPKTQAAMVTHCITGGLQCDTYGVDLYKRNRGAVLDAAHHLLANPAS